MKTVLVLDNPVQNYAWGSRTVISSFLGRPAPSPRPEAELWLGAHPLAPSVVAEPPGVGTLDDAIQEDPTGVLGHAVCDRFGNQLPFLFKLLAVADPMSIQAHPDHEQARRGWNRENAEGIPVEAPHRNYRDPNHKPELLCALTPFTALKGFRPCEEIVRNLDPVARPELASELGRLARERTPAAMRALFARLLTMETDESAPILTRAAAHAKKHSADLAFRWVERLLDKHPSDVGALAPLYLHLVVLAPGEALFVPAGELHTHFEGTALEIMANSDNVLRGGLTAKHVDVPELLATLVFEPREPEVLHPVEIAAGESAYRTDAREFELGSIEVVSGRPFVAQGSRDVEILLGIEGEMWFRVGATAVELGRGHSVLVPACLPGYTIEGEGRVARARVPS